MNSISTIAASSRPLGGMSLKDLQALAKSLGREGKYRSKADAIAAIRAAKRQAARIKPSREGTIRSKAEEILREPGLNYSQALQRVKEIFPEANTSLASLRWYRTQMKKRGEKLPPLPIDYPAQRGTA